MTLKRYLSTLVSPISPRRPRASTSIDSPVSVRSPIEDLRDFWKKTFNESLARGEEYREAALARIRDQRAYLSAAEVWDLQTMNDGLVVERDNLSDFAQCPERLSFEIVSKASRYKSRAQYLYSEVREVVRRSQASFESAQAMAPECENKQRRRGVTRHAFVSGSLSGEGSDMYSRSYESQHANGYSAGTDPAEHCEPPAYDCSSSSSFDSRSQLASLDKHEATILKPCASAWEIAPEDETAELRQGPSGPGTNETILARLDRQAVDVGQWAADIGRHMEDVTRRRGTCHRRSTQSDLSEQSDFSPGPPTPRSSPQSSPASADLSASPAFLKRLDDALKGLSEPEVGPENHSQESISAVFALSRMSPTNVQRHDRLYMPRGPRSPIRATQSQLNPLLPLPFRPMPDLRRAASQPQLQSRPPRERTPVLFSTEDIHALRIMTSELRSPLSARSDEDEECFDEGEEADLLTAESTVETASIIVQPYGHSRANTIVERPIIHSPDEPLRAQAPVGFASGAH